jgi:DNA-directed RNA polymerase specialized sigma24 family protein
MVVSGDDDQPVSVWIDQVKAGDHEALEKIWHAYLSRLLGLVRGNLRQSAARLADPDDIVQSAMISFWTRACGGRYPALNDRDGLWKLLVAITLTKARALSRKEGRRRDLLEQHLPNFGFLQTDPTPEVAAQLTEDFQYLLDRLNSDLLRAIAMDKLEGFTNAEIASRQGKSIPTIERKLRLIRQLWSEWEP